MHKIIVPENLKTGNRNVSLVYDCLSPDEAKKFIDAFYNDDELCRAMDYCDSVNMTFDSRDDGSRISRTVCIFIDGFVVSGTDEYAENLLESERHDMDFICGRIKYLTGID